MSIYELRVFLEDTDAGGIVYHPRYLQYMERARTLFFEKNGFDHAQQIYSKQGNFVVTKMDITYKKAAQLGDQLTVTTKLLKVGGASIVCEHLISVFKNGISIILTQAKVTLAFVCPNQQTPLRFPAPIQSTFQSLMQG